MSLSAVLEWLWGVVIFITLNRQQNKLRGRCRSGNLEMRGVGGVCLVFAIMFTTADTEAVEQGESKLLVPKTATRHSPEAVPAFSHPQNLYLPIIRLNYLYSPFQLEVFQVDVFQYFTIKF
jgi:hypothetical protein